MKPPYTPSPKQRWLSSYLSLSLFPLYSSKSNIIISHLTLIYMYFIFQFYITKTQNSAGITTSEIDHDLYIQKFYTLGLKDPKKD